MNFQPIRNTQDFLDSLRGRQLQVYLMGERVVEPVDHPLIRPSVNAMAMSYQLATDEPDLATATSPFTGQAVNRFLHIATSAEDVVWQNRMQRRLGQLTGTCFQRCVGMDALNALYSVTYEIDAKYGSCYHSRLRAFIKEMQVNNYVIGGAMTDVKGDRSKSPSEQADKDMYLHVTRRSSQGVYVRGAKAHQTGCVNSHWLIVMPTLRLKPEEGDFAIVGAIPVDAPGITYVIGRQSCDTRLLEGEIEAGNANYSGQEALIIFEEVFIPNELIFMDGETEFSAMLVERFTAFHRRSYVCKAGVGDVLIGAAATAAAYNGVERASHVRDKLVEMTLLNETIYATGMASSYQSQVTPAGSYLCDQLLANVCKQQVTRITYEMARLAQDLAGGLLVTLPSDADHRTAETGALLDKYLKGRVDVPTENRRRILRLIENLTLGRNAVGYLTESLHGAGSPQAQRIQIQRQMNLEVKQKLAKNLAGIKEE
ncbi:MAG: 4-hydroxybutyryl-CoA dehydratase [Anaerolineales bacterium]|nr:MAG: 4-hydroxybutyryl-CoA dehydratase [Anaerolineales bacterium]